MSFRPPINRRKLRETGVLTDENFYSELAAEAGMDIEAVQRVYLAQVRVINRNLFKHYAFRLPHLGDFGLPMRAPRLALVGKTRQNIPAMRRLKFYALEKWTDHINNKLNHPPIKSS